MLMFRLIVIYSSGLLGIINAGLQIYSWVVVSIHYTYNVTCYFCAWITIIIAIGLLFFADKLHFVKTGVVLITIANLLFSIATFFALPATILNLIGAYYCFSHPQQTKQSFDELYYKK